MQSVDGKGNAKKEKREGKLKTGKRKN